jgi:membrane protein YdbS with pleckstrin-like domain
VKRALLAFLRVPERPDPPPGSEPTLVAFRASSRFFVLGIFTWLLKQAGALAGILFSLGFFSGRNFLRFGGLEELEQELAQLDRIALGPLSFEGDLWSLFSLIEMAFLGVFAIQFVLGAFLLKLKWEMRWYMVSDESLRIREGLLRIHEQTMTVANIQNMAVRQGPLQKLLGIADLEVQTAGGGGKVSGKEHEAGKGDLHVGRFRGIENAEALRDRIRRALSRHRDSGLGDPDDAHEHGVSEDHGASPDASAVASAFAPSGELQDAVAELLGQASALRRVAESVYR